MKVIFETSCISFSFAFVSSIEIIDSNMKHCCREQLEVLSDEVERLKRSLAAKDEVERTQIEAVHQLTARTKRQEKELSSLHGELDDTKHKLETTKESFELAKK
jgi:tRNA C32,U32 (ribose-2'-O)-methylase TrmJ